MDGNCHGRSGSHPLNAWLQSSTSAVTVAGCANPTAAASFTCGRGSDNAGDPRFLSNHGLTNLAAGLDRL